MSTGVADVPFPPKTWYGGTDPGTVKTRRPALESWMNEVLRQPTARRAVCMFLAEDGR